MKGMYLTTDRVLSSKAGGVDEICPTALLLLNDITVCIGCKFCYTGETDS